MRFVATSTIALLLASGTAFGQTASTAQSAAYAPVVRTESLAMARAASSCPIGMRARHAFFTQRELAGNQHSPDGKGATNTAMALLLTLTPQTKRHIAKAWVTITGLSGAGHSMLTLEAQKSNGAKSPTLTKNLEVSFTPGDDGNTDAYFKAAGFSAINSVQLVSVTYSDGSTWSLPAQDACSVAPDGLMLIAAE